MAIPRNNPHIRLILLLLAAALIAWGGVAAVPACADTSDWIWAPGGTLLQRRLAPTATLVDLLNIGKKGVLLIGGGNETVDPTNPWQKDFNPLKTCEFYALGQKVVRRLSLNESRALHTATLLNSGENAGKVLVVAGLSKFYGYLPGSLKTCELHDPTHPDANWKAAKSLSESRFAHTATLLSDGKVLVTGGIQVEIQIELFPLDISATIKTLESSELYGPDGNWDNATSLKHSRALHTATLLPNGKVLVTGGTQFQKQIKLNLSKCKTIEDLRKYWDCFDITNTNYQTLNSSELYDPDTGSWDNATSLNQPRYAHTATLLPFNTDNNTSKVLVAGGQDNSTIERSCEIYDSKTNKWTLKRDRKGLPIPSSQHTATLLRDGKVLLVGGSVEPYAAQIYDPKRDLWTLTYDFLWYPRSWHTATLLPDGKVLVAGGPPSLCELFQPPSAALLQSGVPRPVRNPLADD